MSKHPRSISEEGDYNKDFLFVTNRTLEEPDDVPIINKSILDVLTDQPADPTSNLRFGRAWNVSGKQDEDSTRWNCDIFPDDQSVGDNPSEQTMAAFQKLIKIGKPIMLVVHGYNNTETTPLQAAAKMRKKHDCTVIPFLWPTNGRTLGYAKDREDARKSAKAFLRLLVKVKACLNGEKEVAERPLKMPRTNGNGNLPKVMLLCHSMGNYLLENAVKAKDGGAGRDYLGVTANTPETTRSFFQNIILTAADVDSYGHVEWVKNLKPKGKVFIFINKDDDALKVSNYFAGLLTGKDNPVRLGQTLNNIKPTFDRIYVHVIVRGKGFDPLQFLELEHSYHADGEVGIRDFFKSVIQDEQKWHNDPDFLPNYYEIEGYSDE